MAAQADLHLGEWPGDMEMAGELLREDDDRHSTLGTIVNWPAGSGEDQGDYVRTRRESHLFSPFEVLPHTCG